MNHKVIWDESVYLGMGKYIYSGGDAGTWEMIRPLGLPIVTGLFWKIGLSGASLIIAGRIFSIIISAGCIIVTFLIAKQLFDNKHALISALIIACSPIFFLYSSYILTDHISTLFLMLSILFLLKRRFVYGGIFGGLAFWFKFIHILYVIAVILFIVYDLIVYYTKKYGIYNKKHSIIYNKKHIAYNKKHAGYIHMLIIIALFVSAYFCTNYALYRDHFTPLKAAFKPYIDAAAYSNNPYQNTAITDISSLARYIIYYPYTLIFDHTYGFLIYTFLLVYFARYSKFIKDRSHALIMFIFFTYLIHFSIIPYKVDRFIITFMPFMAIYAAYGIIQAYERIGKIGRKKSVSGRITTGKISIMRVSMTIILSIIIVSVFALAIHKDMQIYKQDKERNEQTIYPLSNPLDPLQANVENYFDVHNIDGPILVTDPVFAAYSDKRFAGAYDVTNEDGLFVNPWESGMEFNAAAYIDSSIPCLDEDISCRKNKAQLKSMLHKDFTEADSYTYNGANVTFYIRR